MLRTPFFGSLIAADVPEPSTMRLLYDVLMVLLGVALVATALKRPTGYPTIKNHIVAGIGGTTTIVGMSFVNVGRYLSIEVPGLYLAGVLFLCAGFAAITVSWFYQLATLPRELIVPLALAAFIVSHLFGFIDTLTRDAAAVVSTVYPLASVMILISCSKAASNDGAKMNTLSNSDDKTPTPPSENRYFGRIKAFALALVFVEILCGALLRSSWAHGGVNYDPTMRTLYTYLVSAAIGILFLVIARKSKSTAEGTLIIGGIGLAGFVLASVSFTALPVEILSPFVTGLYSALIVYMLAIVALWKLDSNTPSSVCAGIFLALYGLSYGITSTFIPALLSYQGKLPDEYLAPIGLVAGLTISSGICITLFALVVVQRDSFLDALSKAGIEKDSSKHSQNTEPPNENIAHDKAMDALASKFSLTDRERDTASLVAKGYTAKRVAEALVVAPSTVQGYCKSIYRKMDIHRKDELIEAVNQLEQSERSN